MGGRGTKWKIGENMIKVQYIYVCMCVLRGCAWVQVCVCVYNETVKEKHKKYTENKSTV